MSPTIRTVPAIGTDFPYGTTREDVRIPLREGLRLYARVWRPVTEEPVPALLEYSPGRLTDWTAPRDWQRHPWYAGHGYASVRVDVRGHGNSEGVPGDEYDALVLSDGLQVIEWLAGQEWCDGRVGLFGISWGGTCALQLAALAPPQVGAVVSVCSSDDRYDNDGRYLGGSVLGSGLHARGAAALALACLPPDPEHVGEDWRELWVNRLEAVTPPVHTWLAHQTRDAYWRHGSVCEEYGAIQAPVLAVGGWHDAYRDTVLRLVEHLPQDRVRGIVGPWCHQYPDRGYPPGPPIGFLQETLRWWDQHLKGHDTGVMDEPRLRAWISASHPPATVYPELPGRWVGEPSWPSPHVSTVPYALRGEPVEVDSPHDTGLDAGRYVPYGNDADLAPDQRSEDARSACFEFPVAADAGTAGIEVLGLPRVTLRIRSDAPAGQVVARLCDVAPDGASTLVTRGVLNLSARHGRERVVPWREGGTEEITFGLAAIGHTFPPGHRIRLAVSSAYWPWVWPRAESAGFVLEPAGSRLDLPVRDPAAPTPPVAFEPPEQSEPLGVVSPATLEDERPERLLTRDVAQGTWRLEVDPRYGGTRIFPDGLEYTEDALDTCTIQESDPLSARADSQWSVRLHRQSAHADKDWDASVETTSSTTCDAEHFLTRDEVVCRDGAEVVFHRTWERRIPRTAG